MKTRIKRLTAVLLIMTVLLSSLALLPIGAAQVSAVWDGTVGTSFDGGSGTEDDPYLISSGKTLAYLAQSVNGGTNYTGKYFKLTNNIDLNGKSWTPIGNSYTGSTGTTNFFTGTFYGNGYCIKNLNVTYTGSDSEGAYGLFGCLWNGQVYDLGIESGAVSASYPYMGSIAAVLQGSAKISNCYNKATVKKVIDSGNVTAGAQTEMGGIAGYMAGATCSIEKCVNYGDTLVTTFAANDITGVGGICGFAQSGTIENCYNVGNVSGRAHISTGGLVGLLHNTTITNCSNGGLVMAEHREDNGSVTFTVASGYTVGRKLQAASTGTLTNVSAYTAKYSDYPTGKLIYKNASSILSSSAIGTATNGTVSTTVLTSELVLPTAPRESFLKQTEYGRYLLTSVGGGTPTVDGEADTAYGSSYAKLSYGSGTNALTSAAWGDMRADIGVVADYRNVYVHALVTDGDVADGDAIEVWLSTDGTNVVKVSIKKDGTLTSSDTELTVSSAVVEVKNGEQQVIGWMAELAIPAAVMGKESIGLGFKLTDGAEVFSETAEATVVLAKLHDIYGAPDVAVTGITLDKNTLTVHTGEEATIVATVAPENAYNRGVIWTSSDPSVLSVSAEGVVKASRAGTATVTATTADGGYTATCAVTVLPNEVSGVTLDMTELVLMGGKKKMLVCTVAPANADNTAVTWSSSDESVATVSANGLVTALSAGTTTVTVTTADGGFTAECKVAVIIPILELLFESDTLDMSVGDTASAPLVIDPTDATVEGLEWSSSDTGVVTVDENGKITAISAGSATVTVTDGTLSASITVNISDAEAETDASDKEEDGGCGSAIGALGISALAAVCCMGSALAKKKEEN